MGQMMGQMGNVFGKVNPNMGGGASNTAADVKGNNGGWGDLAEAQGGGSGLTGGQLFARKALSGGLGGLGKGLQQPGQMPQGGAPQINAPQAPMVDPSMFGMGRPKNPFYGA